MNIEDKLQELEDQIIYREIYIQKIDWASRNEHMEMENNDLRIELMDRFKKSMNDTQDKINKLKKEISEAVNDEYGD